MCFNIATYSKDTFLKKVLSVMWSKIGYYISLWHGTLKQRTIVCQPALFGNDHVRGF